jgi:hypothetical protein
LVIERGGLEKVARGNAWGEEHGYALSNTGAEKGALPFFDLESRLREHILQNQ